MIPNAPGTTLHVAAMEFSNPGPDSGTGDCFSRDPATGPQGASTGATIPARQLGLVASRLQLLSLAEVGSEGDDFAAIGLLQPLQDDAGV